jgi:hypothetical protein
MTAFYGTMSGAEVDALSLRLPLKKKLAALADLPAHIGTNTLPASTQRDKLLLRSMRTDCFCLSVPFHRSPPVHFIKRGDWTADIRGLPVGPTLQHPRPLQPSTLRR